jgi:potassium/hydrogen antiporter
MPYLADNGLGSIGWHDGRSNQRQVRRLIENLYLMTLIGTGLVLAAALSSYVAFRFGAPLLLLFLGIGLAAGVDGLGIDFDNAPVAYVIGSLALAIVLFDSGFGTPLRSFRIAAAPAITLATLGVLLTTLLVAAAARFALDLSWPLALLLGAIVSSTDAAAVFFLLRIGGITIRERVRATLEVESGTNDPMAVFLVIALAEFIVSGMDVETGAAGIALALALQLIIGLGVGLAGGVAIVKLVNRLRLERGLTPIFAVALSLLVFSAAGIAHGSGFLAVYVAGLWAGNHDIAWQGAIKRFQDGLTWLAQIIMFLTLGLFATPSQFGAVALPAIGLAMFLMLIARPLAVWFCLLPFRFTQGETGFIAWVGLRGAVSILLALVPLTAGIEGGAALFNAAFIMVLVSLGLQGWTIKPLAKRLGLVIPNRAGAVEKVELELPGTINHELLSYRVVEGSPVVRGQRIPRWARPSLVIRDGRSMPFREAGRLIAGDRVFLFVSPRYPRLLDRLFASKAGLSPDDEEFFGEFSVEPSHTLAEVADVYGVTVDATERDITLGAWMKRRLGGEAMEADRVALGDIDLIVREVDDDGLIATIGLSLAPEHGDGPRLPLFANARDLAARIAAWQARRKDKRGG